MSLYNRPSDEQRDLAYKQVAEIANKNGLISYAYGGTLVVLHPVAQREQGCEDRILYAAGLGPFPEKDAS
jgi:hypothetical protein